MTTFIYIDTVLQVYESHGNLHLIGAVSSGEQDQNGKDILEKTLHLTLPMSRALQIIPEISAALPSVTEEEKPATPNSPEERAVDHFEGEGLHFKL
jgi:hypothetical protein